MAKHSSEYFLTSYLALEQLRQERAREQEVFNLNMTRMKNDYLSKMKDLETREREMSLREKEGKRLSSNFHTLRSISPLVSASERQ